MTSISAGRRIEGGYAWRCDDVPINGTSEVQTLTKSGTVSGGTFKLSFRGRLTAALDFDSTAAEIVAALEALRTVGTGNVTATGGPIHTTAVVVTFAAHLGKRSVPMIALALNSLTGSTPSIGIVETTPGVDATALGAPKGASLIDSTHATRYINTGTADAPVWVQEAVVSSELTALLAAIPTAAVADVATADGSDPTSTQALANALKVKVNDLLAKLRTAGIVTP